MRFAAITLCVTSQRVFNCCCCCCCCLFRYRLSAETFGYTLVGYVEAALHHVYMHVTQRCYSPDSNPGETI
jgi:hypothetical protein